MGRLTLNVLLSLAQFEREVTGERIRDKIAASKRQEFGWAGWCRWVMTGNRQLEINQTEAATAKRIFTRYL
jgi:site-specific DNA recombinase